MQLKLTKNWPCCAQTSAMLPTTGKRPLPTIVWFKMSLLIGTIVLIELLLLVQTCLLTHAAIAPKASRAGDDLAPTETSSTQVASLSSAQLLPMTQPLVAPDSQLTESNDQLSNEHQPLRAAIGSKHNTKPFKSFKRRRKINKLGADNGDKVVQLNDKINDNKLNNNNNNKKFSASSIENRHKNKIEQDDRQMESLLVHQLSNLIMNNEPKMIRQILAKAQIKDQLTEETRRLTKPARLRPPASRHDDDDDDKSQVIVDEYESVAAAEDATDEDDDDDDEEDDENDNEDNDEPGEVVVSLDNRLDTGLQSTPIATTVAREKKHRRMADEQPIETSSSYPNSTSSRSSFEPAETSQQSGFSIWSWFGWSKSSDEKQQQQQSKTDEVTSGESLSSSSELPDDMTDNGTGVLVPCSPGDYDDEPSSMDANMNDIMSGANGENTPIGGNLSSAEHGQQIMNGADLAGLFEASNQTADMMEPIQTRLQRRPFREPGIMGECVPVGAQTIEWITKTLTPILFGMIVVVGLIGNAIVICVLFEVEKKNEWNPTNLLILDLSIADLFFIIFCIPFTGWDYAVGHWAFGLVWCKVTQYMIVVCALSSIYTLVLMSVDRYMAGVHPIKCIKYRTSDNVKLCIFGKWAAIVLVAYPTIYMHGLVPSPVDDQFNCRFLADKHNPLLFQIVFTTSSFVLPLCVIFYLYWRLLKQIWFGKGVEGHKASTKAVESKKKISKMVFVIIVTFAVCWFPIQVMLILMRLKSHNITPAYVGMQVFAHIIGYMNSCVNPLIYAFSTDFFLQSFKRSYLGRAFYCKKRSNRYNPRYNHNGFNNGHSVNGLHTSTTVVINSAGSSALGSHHHRQTTSSGAGSRNSLQLIASAGGGSSLTADTANRADTLCQRANKSLGSIFVSQTCEGDTGGQVGLVTPHKQQTTTGNGTSPGHHWNNKVQEPRQLALEPRDRPQVSKLSPVIKQQHRSQQVPISSSSSASQLTQRNQANQRTKATSSSELIPRQPTASARVFQSLEQKQHREQQQRESVSETTEATSEQPLSKEQIMTNGRLDSSDGASESSQHCCCGESPESSTTNNRDHHHQNQEQPTS